MRITAAAVTAAAAAAVFSSCASTFESPEPPGSLAGADPCTVLSGEELMVMFGVPTPGEPVRDATGSGCRFEHPEFQLAITKHEGRGLQYWQEHRADIGLFQEAQIGEHKVLKLIPEESIGQRVCNQSVVVGTGSINVQVAYAPEALEGTADAAAACQKAWEIAWPIEGKFS
ncbi:hypothetical protein GCM10009854_01970 [Saccharopolyspora halophila]|uniref:DUF3558 domain-containing protein n=1 Tax=Saccharopolyspora halophila TaxID=405551 RepID=A0ABP5SGG1_9PSEU